MDKTSVPFIEKNGDGEVFSFCNVVSGIFKKQNETKSGFASGSPGTPWR
jgi:hypothetical protein